MTYRALVAIAALSVCTGSLSAQSTGAPASGGGGVEGHWEGALGVAPNRLRLVLEITKATDGLLFGTLRSIDQGGSPIPVQRVVQAGDSVHVEIPAIGGRYDAVLSADRSQLNGVFFQGRPTPLQLTRGPGGPAAAATPMAAPVNPMGLMIDVHVPQAPTPFSGGGKRHLMYELHITNFAGGELLLTKIDVMSGTTTLMTYEGAALNGILMQLRPGVTDGRSLPAGARAVAFVDIALESGVLMPTSLRHRISANTQTLETANVPVSAAKPIVISSPLRGAGWVAVNGPGSQSSHRRSPIPIGGRVVIAQRFAIDWVRVTEQGSTFTGNQRDNKSYAAYGTEVLAVADGVVSAAKDSIPENIPGATSRAVPITMETIAGNHIVQNLGGGRYALYAHLQPGSLRVKAGDRVRRGQVIGLLGNTGNSTEPHLHFQIMDAPLPLGGEGLPYLIDSWDMRTPSGSWEHRANQLPMQDMIVRFNPPAPTSKKP